MKKKLIPLFMAAVCAATCTLALAACNDDPPATVSQLLIAKTGEQPQSGIFFVNEQTTYGETVNWSFYKLYLRYSNGDTKEISVTDEKLTVGYSYSAYNSTGGGEAITQLPTEYITGQYSINYIYDGNSNHHASAILDVNPAESGAFIVQPANSTWASGENSPEVTLKNPKGLNVAYVDNLSDEMNKDDTNGNYTWHIIKKEAYDNLTQSERTDYDFIENYNTEHSDQIDYYLAGSPCYLSAGDYMLFAVVRKTFNYYHAVTPAVQVRITEAASGTN